MLMFASERRWSGGGMRLELSEGAFRQLLQKPLLYMLEEEMLPVDL